MSKSILARVSPTLLAGVAGVAGVAAVVAADLRAQTDYERIHGIVEVGGRLFFAAERAPAGLELWVTDAGQAGAAIVRDINPGAASAAIGKLMVCGTSVVFPADDGEHGLELWRSDGTAAGTTMIEDLVPGSAGSGLDFTTGAAVIGGRLYFFANDASGLRRLCVTDGTTAGTATLASFEAGSYAAGYSHRMTGLSSGVVVFRVRDSGRGSQLWRTDGTTKGTFRLTDFVFADDSGPLGRIGDRLFFAGAAGKAWDIWFTDGEKAGTRKLHAGAAVAADGAIGGPPPTVQDHKLAKIHFQTYCATCHGRSGKGDGPAALALQPRPRNWTDAKWQASVTDDRILQVVRDGGAKLGLSPLMAPNPMYKNNPAVLKALVALIRKCDPNRKN